MHMPSCENATELTKYLWPSSVLRQAPLPASQILTVTSLDPDTMRVPSCENATDLTSWLWPSSILRQVPLPASQILTVSSLDPDTTHVPSCHSSHKANDDFLQSGEALELK